MATFKFEFLHVMLCLLYLTVNTGSSSSFTVYRRVSVDPNPSSIVFQTNLRLLLSSLISNAPSTSGFYKNSIGETPDRVYGLALCRGDVTSDLCLNCLVNITDDITQHFMDSTQGLVWYEHCLVHYKNHEFFGSIDASRFFQNQTWTGKEYSNVDSRRLIWGLVESAPSRPLMFATNKLEVKKDNFSKSEIRYGLVQCTRDLCSNDCRTCLNELMQDYESCCVGMRGWRIFSGSCSIWYDHHPIFFELTDHSSLRMLQETMVLLSPDSQPTPSYVVATNLSPVSQPTPLYVMPKNLSPSPPTTPLYVVAPNLSPSSISNPTPNYTNNSSPPLTSLQPVAPNDTQPPGPPPENRKGGPILGILVCMVVALLLFFLYKKRSNKKISRSKEVEMFLKNNGPLGPTRYKYSEVKKMTNSFRDKIGQGGYGCVFKGRLANGRLVAVKVLSETKGNGQEFINEVASVGKTYHVNVVALLGFCFQGSKRALVYEYMPNGSLDKYIYGEKPRSMDLLGWVKLCKIALEIARGLEYLHVRCSMRILHLDIKPHNILLDDNFCPKISDFGLAKLCSTKDSTISTLTPRGTMGYAAPEVHCRNFGGVSYKSDVYSYGMMVLEMVGGRKNIDAAAETSQIYFPQWIYRSLNQQGNDIRVEGLATGEEEEMARKMILVALWCIQMSPADRPTMSQVVEMFQGSIEDVPMPPNPFPPPPS